MSKKAEDARQQGLLTIHGMLFDVLSVLRKLKNLPQTEIEAELRDALEPIFARFDERLKSLYSIPQNSQIIGATLKVFCDEHEKPYRERGANMQLAFGKMLQKFMRSIASAESENALTERLRKFQHDGEPICCSLSESDRLELIAQIVPSTGDPEQDALEAEADGDVRRDTPPRLH